MSKHNEGPWDIDRASIDQFSHTSGHYTTNSDYLTVLIKDDDEWADVHGENQQANAALIAKSPEMHALLSDIFKASSCRVTGKFAGRVYVDGLEGLYGRIYSLLHGA